jgi:putative transposase
VVFKSRVFPADKTEENSDEELKIQRCTNHGNPAPSGEWRDRFGALPRTWDEQREFLQVACKVWEMDAATVSQMKAMGAENKRLKRMYAAMSMQVSVALACRTFQISETCYRYERKFDGENAEISDWLVRLTPNRKTWGFRSVFPVSAQREGLRLDPQACESDLLRAGAEPADQAPKTAETAQVG